MTIEITCAYKAHIGEGHCCIFMLATTTTLKQCVRGGVVGQGDDGSWKWCFQRLFYAYAGLPCIIDNGTTKTTKTFRTTAGGRYYIDLDTIISTLIYKNISRTSAVSSTNFGSILIFASCVVGTCNILCICG